MIISIHVTKTAGTSFGAALKREFKERFMHDDEDWAGYKSPEAEARRAANRTRMRDRRDELLQRFDVIHGHFVPEKFAGMFPRADFVAFRFSLGSTLLVSNLRAASRRSRASFRPTAG